MASYRRDMARLLIHGNPETAAIWTALLAALRDRGADDVEAISPPGFGAPTPTGWNGSRISYRDWLVGEIETRGGQADLVGHDWGAGHVLGLLAHRPDLVRTWATDCLGLVHPGYEWHEAARQWQTPGDGEEMIAGMAALSVDERAAGYAVLGIPGEVAHDLAAGFDDEMGRCILALYRSSQQPVMRDIGAALREGERRPGLAVVATDDQYAGDAQSATEVARSLDAEIVRLQGAGHWWMFDHAATVADALVEHWARI